MFLLPVVIVAGAAYAAKYFFNQSQAAKGIDYSFSQIQVQKVTPKLIPPALSIDMKLFFTVINPTNFEIPVEQLFLQVYVFDTVKIGDIVAKKLLNGVVAANDKSDISIPFNALLQLADIGSIIKAAKAQNNNIPTDPNETAFAEILSFMKDYFPNTVRVKGTVKVSGIVKYIDEVINFSS
jgi:hypothetical protein